MGLNDKRLWMSAVFFWGFAEATLFFIVPDVALTASLLFFGLGFAFRLAGLAALGALAGGVLMYVAGASDIDAARAAVGGVPLVGPDLFGRVQHEIAGAWPVNLAIGAVSGAPYKLYAVEAGAAGIDPLGFAVVSVTARFLRFSLAISIAAGGFWLARRLRLGAFCGPGLAIIWGLIYTVYAAIRLTA
ncbi:MAG: hypothetical protein AAGD92_12655 [Pseudomonadota bacterium]